MNTPYENLPLQDRVDWLSSPVTAAFLDTIMGERNRVVGAIIDEVKGGPVSSTLTAAGGMLKALDHVLFVAAKGAK